MAYDIALDKTTGDWLFSANTDLQGVAGEQVVAQRIMTRLRMARGWDLDPTRGSLGSRLRTGLRLQRGRLKNELPLMVEEALSPMRDVQVLKVWVEELVSDVNALLVHVDYAIVNPTTPRSVDLELQQSIAFEVGS